MGTASTGLSLEQDAEGQEDFEIWAGISEVSVQRQRIKQRKNTVRQEYMV